MAILAVNAGSSSIKFSIYPQQGDQVGPCILGGNVEGLEPNGEPVLCWSWNGHSQSRPVAAGDGSPFSRGLQSLRQLLAEVPNMPTIDAVAHRVVHGGQIFTHSVRVTEAVLEQLATLNSLAPLHQPHNLQGVRAFIEAFPEAVQVACFDTAFHAGMSELNYRFALPETLTAQGVRRYGFHGLSYQYVMGVLLERSARGIGRVLMAHLGNGASLCAAQEGHSVATTMGFSAVDGLMMGTRTGSLDAGVLLYLLEQGWDRKQIEKLLYKQSGLLGVSGLTADMRRLRADGSEAAQRAIDLFTHRVVREAGGLTACMGGLDVLAFSGGIGEHDAILRAEVADRLAYLGVEIDTALNRQAVGNVVTPIHTANSRVEVWVVPTDEGRVAAADAAHLLAAATV